jgi:enediyne biosynthesis protein E5
VSEPKKKDTRLAALRRFGIAITTLNLFGHTYLGFEQSWAYPFASLAAAYSCELLLGTLDARARGQRPRYLDGGMAFVDFFLPAHISGLAVAMLLYSNERVLPIVFAATVAIASKYVFRVEVDGRPRHFLNPSNLGITATLVGLPWVGFAPTYMFTENLNAFGDYLLPCVIICTGSLLNTFLTKRIPLIVGWVGTFVLQAVLRSVFLGQSLTAALNAMTGVAFILFTFYMVTDPSTTPSSTKGQVAFGASVAAGYGILTAMNRVFALFFSLCIVCTIRGIYMYVEARGRRTAGAALPSAA